MKFVPRQPQPPSPRTSTTRRLRLQPADEVETTSVRSEPRPLPAFPDPPAQPSGRTASQRVRLRLDPAVASQPLPEAERLLQEPVTLATRLASLDRAPVMEPIRYEPPAAVETPEENVLPSEPSPVEEESSFVVEPEESLLMAAAESAGPVLAETAEPEPPAVAEPESPLFEMPPSPDTISQVWVPPGPGHAPISSWLPPAKPHPVAEEAAPAVPAPEVASTPPAVEESASRRPARPALRRPPTSLTELSRPKSSSLGRGFWILLILFALILFGLLYFFGIAPRLAAYQARTRPPAAPVVERSVMFVAARFALPTVELPVSGVVEPSRETALYARTTGYVKAWLVDLGDKVQAGQVLAELDTPEIDHELTQARASADQAKAQVELAQNQADRWAAMAKAHAVAQTDADEKTAALNAAQANFNAAEANVGRLVDLEMFKEIRAPYAGTISARNLEVGTLVGAGPGPAGSELFRLTQTDPVRVFVNVPDSSAPAIHAGVSARVRVAAYPGRDFTGEVVRDAGSLDATTHTLRTEVHVANPEGVLMPGTEASVRLQLTGTSPALLVPTNAIVMSSAGPAIARLTPADGREVVHFLPVKIGRTFGDEVELLGNPLDEGDRLVANPPDDLRDGMIVNAQPWQPTAPPTLLAPHPSSPRV